MLEIQIFQLAQIMLRVLLSPCCLEVWFNYRAHVTRIIWVLKTSSIDEVLCEGCILGYLYTEIYLKSRVKEEEEGLSCTVKRVTWVQRVRQETAKHLREKWRIEWLIMNLNIDIY